jgi:hypothetical protein
MKGSMEASIAGLVWLLAATLGGGPAWSADAVETIVMLRHGEKPAQGLGQLTCQGLNRALALPPVIAKNFGKPIAIFASNPSDQKRDHGTPYDYIRPLATIEPTAILFGLPVITRYGVSNLVGLRKALLQPPYQGAVVLLAWEHRQIVTLARDLIAKHGGEAQVPNWRDDDFDSIYVVTITRSAKRTSATFTHMREGLDGQALACPLAVKPIDHLPNKAA